MGSQGKALWEGDTPAKLLKALQTDGSVGADASFRSRDKAKVAGAKKEGGRRLDAKSGKAGTDHTEEWILY